LTLTCSSITSGRLWPVRLNTHDTTKLNEMQKTMKASGRLQWAFG
jgi:hypothetical protein